MQERTERALGSLLKLSLTTDRAEVERGVATVDGELKQLDALLKQIRELDPQAGGDLSEFKSAREQIAATANKRLEDDAAYRSETENARAALRQAEEVSTPPAPRSPASRPTPRVRRTRRRTRAAASAAR